ncbi:hypothetical protein, partial [Streptomyces ziwulingensis]
VGENIGQFKLEHVVKRGYFISSKTYCLITDENKVIIKAKGVDSDSLTVDSFVDLYKGSIVEGDKLSKTVD